MPDDAPISLLTDTVLISADSKEAGLWLWQGEAPPPASAPRPKSRDRQILHRIMSAGGWVGWIALPTGLALTLIAISMMPHPDRPVSADRPAVAPSSAPSPTVARPVIALSAGRARDGQIGSGANAVGAGHQNYGARFRTANCQIACTTQIVASREKNTRIARSQRTAIPNGGSAHATAHDVAWWGLLTGRQ